LYLLADKNKYIKELIDNQKINNNVLYRPFKYITNADEDGGIILLNNLTDEAIFLNESEKEIYYQKNNYSNEIFLKLVNSWFLVPENFNDLAFSKNIEDTISLLYRTYRKKPIDSFTILTTTDCNARCFYCYQLGCDYKTMSKQTANDVAEYILKHKSDKELLLRWFGGEPLYNSDAIDIIVDKLIDNNVKFKSIMTTNGYLFDEKTVVKAKNKWNLYRVQITLDGTEKIYNKIKAYIYKTSKSPYKIVTNNIETLLQNDVIVNVRMNMDMHNAKDLFILTDELMRRYKNYDNFYAYVHLLYDNSCEEISNRDNEEKEFLQKQCDKLLNYIKANGKSKKRFFKENIVSNKVFHCMADTDSSIMILPDGKLGKCEHFLDERLVGSIYDENINIETINMFKTLTTICSECDDCELRSRCRSLKCCHSTKNYCSKFDRMRLKDSFAKQLKDLYHSKINSKG